MSQPYFQLVQVAPAWVLSKPGITAPIIGAMKPHHLKDAITALSVALTLVKIQQLEEMYRHHPFIGFS